MGLEVRKPREIDTPEFVEEFDNRRRSSKGEQICHCTMLILHQSGLCVGIDVVKHWQLCVRMQTACMLSLWMFVWFVVNLGRKFRKVNCHDPKKKRRTRDTSKVNYIFYVLKVNIPIITVTLA
jgi:hypothetical protein